MSSRNSPLSTNKSAPLANRADKSAVGGAAGVEIVSFPQILYTRTFGDPDMLFVPLLDGSREAFGMIERLSGHGEDRKNAVMLSGMQLVSSLLRDSSFSLVARGLSHENAYTVDLDGGTLHVNTRLYAVVSRRTSFFKVEIAGKLSGGPFVVRNPANGFVIMQVDEQRLRQPNFFSASLAQECLRVQIEQERFGRIDDALGQDGSTEMHLAVNVGSNRVPVILRQKEDGTWDIIDGRNREWVGSLPADVQAHLKGLTAHVEELFSGK